MRTVYLFSALMFFNRRFIYFDARRVFGVEQSIEMATGPISRAPPNARR